MWYNGPNTTIQSIGRGCLTLPVFLAIHPGFCNRRIERLCRIIVHDPSVKRVQGVLDILKQCAGRRQQMTYSNLSMSAGGPRIERLCRIIVHDPSVKRRMAALSALSPPQAGPRMGSLHDMDCCGFLPCRTKNLSRQSAHAEILNRLLDGLQGLLTQSGRKICRQGGRGEMLNRRIAG